MIRPAHQNDLFEIRTLAKGLRAHSSSPMHRSGLGKTPDLSDSVSDGSLFVLRDSRLKGYMQSFPRDDVYYIETIELATKSWRDCGSRQMMVFAEARARDSGCKTIALPDNKAMSDHISFCRSQGYSQKSAPETLDQDHIYFEMGSH